MISLRPYQQEAMDAVFREWGNGVQKTLLVLVTGGGKTIVFSKIISRCVREGKRVLILAHRGELLDQAADKLYKATGLKCAVEKAEQTSASSWYRVTVGSIQTLMRDKRLQSFAPDYFDVIVVDEAHHALSEGYQKVLKYFDKAKVLGVTATPDRGDMKELGTYFESMAYEYPLPRAIKDGYLCRIKALTIPLKLDISGVGVSSGDFKVGEIGSALDPYLEQIADEMTRTCMDRKTVVFLPLIATSQKFMGMLNRRGFNAEEVNGESEDRAEILKRFESGETNVLCNSMLLTEGWDCPSVDCVVILRPTKARSLFTQMVGRGTRLHPGKDHLLLLDFLWQTERLDLCRPASLICTDEDVSKCMTKRLLDEAEPIDITEVETLAEQDALLQREEALAEKLREMRKKKRALVDPLQYAMSIQDADLSSYRPSFGWESEPASEKQNTHLEKLGIFAEEVTAGAAEKLLTRLEKRKNEGYATPKQIRLLERYGFKNVGVWSNKSAAGMITRIAANTWRLPRGVVPEKYIPQEAGFYGDF